MKAVKGNKEYTIGDAQKKGTEIDSVRNRENTAPIGRI